VVGSDLAGFTLDKFTYDFTPTTEDNEVSSSVADGNFYLHFRTINAGEYEVNVSDYDNENYKLDEANGTFKILKKTLTVTAWEYVYGINSGIYNNDTKFVYFGGTYTLTPVWSGVVEGESVELTLENNEKTNAGTYKATASLDKERYINYQMTTATLNWSILAKVVSLVWAFDGGDGFQCEFDGNYHTVTATALAEDVVSGDSITIAVSNGTNRLANTYIATATDVYNEDGTALNKNYQISKENEEDYTKTYVINKKVVTFAWKVDGKEGLSVEYNGKEHTVIAEITNQVVDAPVSVTAYESGISGADSFTSGNTATDKATYLTKATLLSDMNNYVLPANEEERSIEWVITPILLSVEFVRENLTYNKTQQGISAVITKIASSDLENDSIAFATEGTTATDVTVGKEDGKYYVYFKAIDAGDYTAVLSEIVWEKKDNYALPENNSSQFKIEPLVVALTWDNANYVYNTENKTVSATVTNKIEGDVLTLTYKTTGNLTSTEVTGEDGVGNVAKNADTYTTLLTNIGNSNYTLTNANNQSVTWTIEAKEISEVVWSEDKEFTYDGQPHSITATVTKGATADDDGKAYDSDNLTLSYSVSEVIDAGEYEVNITALGNGNYKVTDVSETLTILRKALVVSFVEITDSEFKYSGKAQGLRVTVSGVVASDNNDTALSLEIDASFVGNIGAISRDGGAFSQEFTAISASTYTLTAQLTGTKSGNYTTTSPISSSFIIEPKTITTEIMADVQTKAITYSARPMNDEDLNVVFDNLVTGETLTLESDFIVTYEFGGNQLVDNPTNVGLYVAIITLKETAVAKNYVLKDGSARFEFNIIEYEITPEMLTWSVGGNNVNINSLTYVYDEAKTIVASVNADDEVYHLVAGKTISQIYFGFCTCGESVNSATGVNLEHQHFL
ncbi:MAG: hypothetical protein IKB56_02580, partial [Clostridia bacterium]|nr:hypothetical protein [Clostridia bacterium]